jgi:cytochrome c553
MSRRLADMGIALVLAVSISGDSALSAPPPVRSPAGQALFDAEALLRKMHRHFSAIRAIHRALLLNDLQGARRRARSLELVGADGEFAAWEHRVARIRSTARRLASGTSAREARSLVTALATQCADCHADTADVSRFVWAAEPSDDGSASARMERHEWAADMVWMGLVAPSSERWRDGLDVLSAPPLLPEAMSDDREHYAAIEDLSRRLAAKAARARMLQDAPARAAAFADMMGVCAGCHAITVRPAR